MIDTLKQQIADKQRELETLRMTLAAIRAANSETCPHSRMQKTPYDESCPDCSYYRDRSF